MGIESQLIERFLVGDPIAFEELVLLYSKRIYNYCFRMTNNSKDAEDLAQEVFIKVYKNLDKFKKESKFSTWIYAIAYNTCVDSHRKRRYNTVSLNQDKDKKQGFDFPAKDPLPEDHLLSRERQSFLKECIVKLRPEYRSVIILRDIQNYSYKEIGDILAIPPGTVKSSISRARAALREIVISKSSGPYGEGGIN